MLKLNLQNTNVDRRKKNTLPKLQLVNYSRQEIKMMGKKRRRKPPLKFASQNASSDGPKNPKPLSSLKKTKERSPGKHINLWAQKPHQETPPFENGRL